MSFWDFLKPKEKLDEAEKSFKKKGSYKSPKYLKSTAGEGYDEVALSSVNSLTSFNLFHDRYISESIKTEKERLSNYRNMSTMPEIADIIEDAVSESVQEDSHGNVIKLDIIDEEINKNKNIVKILEDEFDDLFFNKMDINKSISDLFRTYFIDGKVYFERIINTSRKSEGIIDIKKLPSETMDFIYNKNNGQILAYFQYVNGKPDNRMHNSIEEAEADPDVVVFYPEQMSYIDYGIYGGDKKSVFGFLEKARTPFNQLKLLETSVIIYRIIRAPERLVFKIDTGQMPRDKAMKFVENLKEKFTQKVTYDPDSGQMGNTPNITSILENFFIPQSADGRGSSIETIGGNPAGFSELDDIYYFARKLYKALKYPMSRVESKEMKDTGNNLFGGNSVGEISRDEIKWARFLETQQNKFCLDLEKLFLLHLDFKGLKSEYEIDKSKINVTMTPPSLYKQQMEQNFLETQFSNYNNLCNNEEFSKSFLQKKFLGWSDEEIRENAEGFELDKKLKITKSEEY